MFRIINKSKIHLHELDMTHEQINSIPLKFIRSILEFDGSMTKFILNMKEQKYKPVINIIQQTQTELLDQENSIQFTNGMKSKQNTNLECEKLKRSKRIQASQSLQSLIDLKKVFLQRKKREKQNLIVRTIEFNIKKEDKPFKLKNSNQSSVDSQLFANSKPQSTLSELQLLYFARSYWKKDEYLRIMQKDKTQPIGLNLIRQQIPIFRKLNWTGLCDIQILKSHLQQNCTNNPKSQSKLYKDVWSRSYTMISGQPLCELEEFFLPELFQIFNC